MVELDLIAGAKLLVISDKQSNRQLLHHGPHGDHLHTTFTVFVVWVLHCEGIG